MGKSKKRGFTTGCILASRHDEWGIVSCEDDLVHTSKITAAKRDRLLSLRPPLKSRQTVRFCQQCITFHCGELGVLSQVVPESYDIPVCENDHETIREQQLEEYQISEEVGIEQHAENRLELCKRLITEMTSEERAIIAELIGKIESDNVKKNCTELMKRKGLTDLKDMNLTEVISNNNKVVSSFLCGIGNIKIDEAKQRDLMKIAKALEQCMHLTMPVSVLPFHFRELVLVYSLTRSRMALSLLGGGAPSGSYKTLRQWLKQLATQGDVTCSLSGSLLAVFDNNQVMQRRWQIATDNKAKCDVITMVMFMQIDSENQLQSDARFKPDNWMKWQLCESQVQEVKNFHQKPSLQTLKLMNHTQPFLSRIIQEVAAEQVCQQDGSYVDDLDTKVEEAQRKKLYKECPNPDCGNKEMPKLARKCTMCKRTITESRALATLEGDEAPSHTHTKETKPSEVRVVFKQNDDNTYKLQLVKEQAPEDHAFTHLPNNVPAVPPTFHVGQPVFQNPCSFKAVAQVLREIGQQGGVKAYGGSREWLVVMSDGLPYNLALQVLEKAYICSACSQCLMGHKQMQEHRQECAAECRKEFSWVILRPGPGHVEMNMLKAYVKLTWHIFYEDMVEVFDFKSPNAKKAAHSVSDHHKGMTLATIARESITKELVLPFVRKELRSPRPQLTVAKFVHYISTEVRDPNYAFMLECITQILDSIFLYRAGLRCNIPAFMDIARAEFAKVWNGRPHPLYRQLDVVDTIMSQQMPPELAALVQKTYSFSLSGIPYTGEGGDFKLEEVNRAVQHWIPAVPDADHWKAACANFAQLKELRRSTLQQLEVKDPTIRTAKPKTDLRKQIEAYRVHLRATGYLTNPDIERDHRSVTGKPLDKELINFTVLAEGKRGRYIDNLVNMKAGSLDFGSIRFKEPPVFITPEERAEFESVANNTVSELKAKLCTMVESVTDPHIQQVFLSRYQEICRKGKKADYVELFHLLEEYLELQEQDEDFLREEDTDD